MKKLLSFAMFCILSFSLCSCARVNYGLNKSGDIDFDSAGGYSSPERGIDVKDRQIDLKNKTEEYETFRLLNQKYQETILKNDKKLADYYYNEMQKIKKINVETENYTKVRIKNRSSFNVSILTGEFKGLTLKPSETSKFSRQIPIGKYAFDIDGEFADGRIRKVTIERIIVPNQKYIFIKNKRY